MHSIKWPEKNHREKRVKQRRGNQEEWREMYRENGGGEGRDGLKKGKGIRSTRKYSQR